MQTTAMERGSELSAAGELRGRTSKASGDEANLTRIGTGIRETN
jgi:hypothetical protein